MALTRLCEFCLMPLRECLCEDVEAPPTWDVPPLECVTCGDTGHVCENHPSRPWGALCCSGPAEMVPGGEILCSHGACHCGGAGQPCGSCCSPVAGDGTGLITGAFTPDGKRK